MQRFFSERPVWLMPILWGLLIGLFGALIITTVLNRNIDNDEKKANAHVQQEENTTASKEKTPLERQNETFFWVLLACLAIGGGSVPLAVRWIRGRARRELMVAPTTQSVTISTQTFPSDSGAATMVQVGGFATNTDIIAPIVTPTYLVVPNRPPITVIPLREGEEAIWDRVRKPVERDVYTWQKTPDVFLQFLQNEVQKGARWKKAIQQQLGEEQYRLVTFYSEGPIQPDGTSPYGWTFVFAHPERRVGCIATVTSTEIFLHYDMTVDVELPWDENPSVSTTVELSCPNPSVAYDALLAQFSDVADIPLYYRYTPDDTVWLYTSHGEAVAQLQVTGKHAQLLHPDAFKKVLSDYQWSTQKVPSCSVQHVVDWSHGVTVEASLVTDWLQGYDITTLLQVPSRETSQKLQDIGSALLAFHGAEALDVIQQAIDDAAAADELDTARLLIVVLSFVPMRSALARLYSLTKTVDERLRPVANDALERQLNPHAAWHANPLDTMDFFAFQAAKGKNKNAIISIALQPASRYDVVNTVLKPLRELGLETHRVRWAQGFSVFSKDMMSLEAEEKDDFSTDKKRAKSAAKKPPMTIVGAWLSCKQGRDCEASLVVIPASYPVMALHLMGKDAENLKIKIEANRTSGVRSSGVVPKLQVYRLEQLENHLRFADADDVQRSKAAAQENTVQKKERHRTTPRQLMDFHDAVLYLQVWNSDELSTRIMDESQPDLLVYLVDAYMRFHADMEATTRQVRESIVQTLQYLTRFELASVERVHQAFDRVAEALDIPLNGKEDAEKKETNTSAVVLRPAFVMAQFRQQVVGVAGDREGYQLQSAMTFVTRESQRSSWAPNVDEENTSSTHENIQDDQNESSTDVVS